MRKILLLSVALAVFLLVLVNVQRSLVLAFTNRPFLGIWTQDGVSFPVATPSHIEFQRGGVLWISRFGEPRRKAHWEDGTGGREIIVTDFDPARPNAREAYRWTISRSRLMLFPAFPPGPRVPVFRPGLGSIQGRNWVRTNSREWSTPQSFTGRWTSPLGRRALRMRSGRLPRVGQQRLLLDVQPGGKLWFYEQGRPRRQGSWAVDEVARSFAMVLDLAGSSSGREIWAGQLSHNMRGESINFGVAGWVQTSSMPPALRAAYGYVGPFEKVAEGPAGRRPYLGAWRTRRRFADRHLQLELLAGGKLQVTEADGSSRQGTWREDSLWPRLTLTGLDAQQPARETEWYWRYQQVAWYQGYDALPRAYPNGVAEVLELFDTHATVTEPSDGTALYMERLQPPSKEMVESSKPTRL